MAKSEIEATNAQEPPATTARSRWKQRLQGFGTALARVVLALLFALGLFLTVTPVGRAATRAAILLPSLIDATQFQGITAGGDAIHHQSIQLANDDGTATYLDVYAPSDGPPPVPGTREAVLMIPGVGDNRQDPQLVNLSQAFARSGIVVMNLTTTTLINYALTANDSQAVVASVQRLQQWPGVDPHHVGIIGFSAGGGLGVLAAADPRIRDQLAFVTNFGGYYDVQDFLRVLGRRAQVVDGHDEAWLPQPLYDGAPPLQSVPMQVLSNTVAPFLPAGEGDLIAGAFQNGTPLDPTVIGALSAPSRAIYHLLAGDTPDQTDANLAALTPAIHDLLRSVSPSTVVGQLHCPLYLLHDRADRYVPFTESRHFANAYTGPHDEVEFSIFQHVEVKSGNGLGTLLGDGARLYRVLVELLTYAG